MIEILPAIIPEDIEDLQKKLALVRGVAPVVQVDILDGRFAPGKRSWPFHTPDKEYFKKLLAQEEGLPFWEDFYFEADLMIVEPEKHIEDFIFAGFSRFIVHLGSTQNMGVIIEKAKELDAEIGIAIGIDTEVELLEKWIERIDVVQCMGIAEIGAQGEPFDPRVVEKIMQVRALSPDIIISVDGGVSLENASFLVGAGADRLVSGSALFESEDIGGMIARFQNLSAEPQDHYEE
ncbi:MAG: hypothetical protein AAB769_00355 [Patescibacteria group bacterium]